MTDIQLRRTDGFVRWLCPGGVCHTGELTGSGLQAAGARLRIGESGHA